MSILDRYIGLDFLKSLTFALLAFTLIVILNQANNIARIETDQPSRHIYLYLFYTLPQTISLVLPGALMFGVCFTVAQFTTSREMVACFSAGRSFYRIIAPILIGSVLTAIGLFLLNEFLVGPANRLANEQETLLKKGTRHATIKGLVFQRNLRGQEGYYFIYFMDEDRKRIVGGFNYLRTSGDGQPELMLQAREAQYRPETEDWLLKEVREIRFAEFAIDDALVHAELDFTFPENYDFFTNPQRDPSELNMRGLLAEIERRGSLGMSTAEYYVELHSDLAFPFMCIILAIVGSIGGNMGSLRSGGPLIRALLISIGAMLLYYSVFSYVSALGRSGTLHPVVASWGPTAVFFVAALVMVWRYRR